MRFGFETRRIGWGSKWLRAIAVLALLAGSIVFLALPSSFPIEIIAGEPEKAEMMIGADGDLFVVPVTLSVPGQWLKPNSAVFFKPRSTRAEARTAGASNGWVKVHCTLPLDRVSAGWQAQGTVLVGSNAEAIRFRFKCAGLSMKWRFVRFIERRGVNIPRKYYSRLGPLHGSNPSWKEVILEVPISKPKPSEKRNF